MTTPGPRRTFARLEWDRRPVEEPSPLALEACSHVLPGSSVGKETSADNRLIAGDNLGVMTTLLKDYEGRIDLIYADPPFLTGKAFRARVGRNEDSRRPAEWRTIDGYNDKWQDGGAYLDMLYPRLELMHRLLSENGSLYLHLDWHSSAYARILLDEIFGPQRLLNEIVWVYHGPSPIRSAFNRKHDTLLLYTKSEQYTFNADAVRVPYNPSTLKTFSSSPSAGFGKVPDLERGKVPEDWWYFPVVARLHAERTGYPTQKPEALLERIILASSNPGNLVADFFCGAGTTAVAAARHQRRWLACDMTPLAVATTHRRLLLSSDAPYAIWRSPAAAEDETMPVFARVSAGGSSAAVELVGFGSENQSLQHVALWEVDWEYDGKLFRSQAQAVRPWRSDELISRLEHHYPQPGERQLCLRVSDVQGRIGSQVYKLTIPA